MPLLSVVWKQLSSPLVIWPFNLHQNVINLLITSACFMINIKTGYSNPTTQAKHKDSCVLKVHWLITTRSINHLDQRKVCLYLKLLKLTLANKPNKLKGKFPTNYLSARH